MRRHKNYHPVQAGHAQTLARLQVGTDFPAGVPSGCRRRHGG